MAITQAKCTDWKCTKEAKWETEPRGDQTEGEIACGIHGPGLDKRSLYRMPRVWKPISPEAIKRSIERQKAAAAVKADAAAERAATEHERQRDLAVIYWQRVADESDYIIRYEEEDRWDTGTIVRNFFVFDTKYLAEWDARVAESPEEYKHSSPSAVVTSIAVSSELTARLAPVYAEALIRATAMAESMNQRLRVRHGLQESRRVKS